MRSDGGAVNEWDGEFETFIRIGSNGSAEKGRMYSKGPVVACMYRKMRSSHESDSPLFPVPPKGSYWVKIELDWADFAPHL